MKWLKRIGLGILFSPFVRQQYFDQQANETVTGTSGKWDFGPSNYKHIFENRKYRGNGKSCRLSIFCYIFNANAGVRNKRQDVEILHVWWVELLCIADGEWDLFILFEHIGSVSKQYRRALIVIVKVILWAKSIGPLGKKQEFNAA